MIPLKTQEEIEAIMRGGRIIGLLHEELPGRIRPGQTTADIDGIVEDFIRSHEGAEPAFKGLYGFPASACISVNEEVVHGIPNTRRVLVEGDLVSVDVGVKLEGWFSDSARTFPVGEPDAEAERLLATTRAALVAGIRQARSGMRLGDIGNAIQRTAEDEGYSIVRELVGHGIGRAPHEDPQVPNFGRSGRGLRLQAGMVLAIEPMVNEGSEAVRTLADRWTVVTVDGRRSAHFEHTVAILEDGPCVLTLPDSRLDIG